MENFDIYNFKRRLELTIKRIAIWANKDLDKTDKKDMVKIIGM